MSSNPGLWSQSLAFGVALFSVLNPLGALPVFLAFTKEASTKEIKRISSTCAFTVFITIMAAMVFGQELLGFFGITLASFRVGGGIFIAIMALAMLSGDKHSSKLNSKEVENHESDTLGVVPLAIPLLAGPGTITASILYSEQFHSFQAWGLATSMVAVIAIVVKLILHFGRPLGQRLGVVGLNVFGRVMGLILMAMAVESISAGLRELFPLLKGEY